MDTGSKNKIFGGLKLNRGRQGLNSKHPNLQPYFPERDHNPRDLKSWAKSTGYVSTYSTETSATNYTSEYDLEKGDSAEEARNRPGSSNIAGIDPTVTRTRGTGVEIEPDSASRLLRGRNSNGNANGGLPNPKEYAVGLGTDNDITKNKGEEKKEVGSFKNGAGFDKLKGTRKEEPVVTVPDAGLSERKQERTDGGRGVEFDMCSSSSGEKDPQGMEWHRLNRMRFGLRDNPGFVQSLYYALQHYLSMAGSLIFIPLLIVPSMGGTDRDTATVISTILLMSGITTILHSYFGTRLPVVQGSSFVFLAPVLVIINAKEYRNLNVHRFRFIMRELQGAIIIGSLFQSVLGFSGLMSLILRLINPVVVAPTIAAVGLAFLSYGFAQAGSCVEVSVPLIILVLLCALHLRGVSVFGHQLFRIYAVPLSVITTWAYAFFLTAGGVYNYKGCSPDIPSSNILSDACRKHAYTMLHCRTDVSNAFGAAAWIRVPYPFQWGVPIFRLRTSLIMVLVSLIASVDSVGIYHSTALLVTSRPPTAGIVSRGIALEGFCSILAGLWGTGTGSTTLTENVHTINVTKVASRKVVQIGAVLLILFSFVGKIGAFLASIPLALVASILCFMWGLMVALGLSTLHQSQIANSRNFIIVGISLFLGLSIPAYVQQYEPVSSLILPGYLIPFSAASSGPVNSSSLDFNFVMNALLSLNMVVTFLIAFVLDITVPGSKQDRGVYTWSVPDDLVRDPSLREDYALPGKISWFKCLCP